MKNLRNTGALSFACLGICLLLSWQACGKTGDTLSIVNWNIEWFADGKTLNARTQTIGVRAMMTAMNADIYALCEVVNTDSLASVVKSLPGGYGYEVAPFGSLASSPSASSYAGDQKLGFVYRKSLVRRITTSALLSGSTTAYDAFSSGRYPFLVNAELLGKDSVWRAVSFIIIHAKAYTDAASCSRRMEGCKELKDSLDRYMPYARFLILGDYNDDLDTSICAGGTQSNYAYMVNDSAHYKALTLPISRAGAYSIDGYSSLIDHVIASDEMASYYVPGSAEVLRPLARSVDPNYDNDISDHFPVRTRYVMRDAPTGIAQTVVAEEGEISPNPARGVLFIRHAGEIWKEAMLVDMQGRLVKKISLSGCRSMSIGDIPAGLYLMRLVGENGRSAMEKVSIR